MERVESSALIRRRRADRHRGRQLTRDLTRDRGRGVWALLALLLVLAPSLVHGAEGAEPGAEPDSDQSRAERVDALFADFRRSDSPGGVAAVIEDGRIVHTVAYGMADLERGVAVSPGSVFEIGSVSKQFTAMCVLLLEHDGALSLDDDVRKHVPELPDYGSPITLRHLLHHTSGIRDVETLIPLAGWHYPSYYAPDQLLGLVTRQESLNFAPGEQFLYSNSGYQLLAEVVERVSGKTLRRFAEERIFEPLGMEHTVFFDDPGQVTRTAPCRTPWAPTRSTGWSSGTCPSPVRRASTPTSKTSPAGTRTSTTTCSAAARR